MGIGFAVGHSFDFFILFFGEIWLTVILNAVKFTGICFAVSKNTVDFVGAWGKVFVFFLYIVNGVPFGKIHKIIRNDVFYNMLCSRVFD